MTIYLQKVLVTSGIIAGIIIIPLSLYYILPHFLPFIIAYFIALILEPINQWLMKQRKINRPIAVNITYFLFIGLFILLSYFIVTKITTQMIDLIKFIQRNIPHVQAWFLHINQQIQDFLLLLPEEIAMQINQSLISFINQLASIDLLSDIGTRTYNITTAIPNFFLIIILILVSLFLFSLHLPRINRQFYDFFKERSKKKLNIVLNDLRLATIGFMQAQFILSTITYIISLFALAIMDVRYSLAISLFIVLVDILPILGTGSVLVPWAIFSFTRGNTFLGIGLIILFIFITVVRRVIEPKILGERIGLSPLSTLISIWIGFKVLGILGIFLGPLLIILYKALVKAEVIKYQLKI